MKLIFLMTFVNAGCQVGPLDQVLKRLGLEEREELRAIGGHFGEGGFHGVVQEPRLDVGNTGFWSQPHGKRRQSLKNLSQSQ